MTAVSSEILGRVDLQRVKAVQRLLWVLLTVIVVNLAIAVATVGSAVLSNPALVPNLLAIPVIGAALWLNVQGNFRAAVLIVLVLTLGAATMTLFATGVGGSAIALLFLAVPVVLAGLVLSRAALVFVTAWSVGALMLVPALDSTNMVPVPGNPAWRIALEGTVLLLLIAYLLDRFGLVFRATLTDALDYQVQLKEQAVERVRSREALEAEQKLTDAVIEGLPGIFGLIDEDGNLSRWNRNLDRVLGVDHDQTGATRPELMVAEADRDKLRQHVRKVFETGNYTTELSIVGRGGDELPYLLTGSRISLGGKDYVAGVGIDRSELMAARTSIDNLNLELKERLDHITALHEIDRAITGSLDLGLTLDVVLHQVTARLKIDAAAILLLEPASHTLVFGASHGFNGKALRATSLRLGEGVAGRAALERERVLINDPEEFVKAFAEANTVLEDGFRSYLATPLLAKGRLLGVLELFHRSPLEPTDVWYGFLTTLATQAAIALDNATLLDNLERSNTELRLAYDRTIEGWARALDLRDEETEGHSRRVTDMTIALAARMGMRREELVHVRRGALLHDIGKMGVPDSILLKPGKLDAEEWEVMKKHPTYAVDLLAPIDFLQPALEIPLCHHEKWNGTGYPNGLRGAEIPIAARVFSVVDVWDALTSKRPYREAWDKDEALDYIEHQKGAHFEPEVVDAFIEMRAITG